MDETTKNSPSDREKFVEGIKHLIEDRSEYPGIKEAKIKHIIKSGSVSPMYIEHIIAYPTPTQVVVIKLAVERGMDREQIVAVTNLSRSYVGQTISLGHALGVIQNNFGKTKRQLRIEGKGKSAEPFSGFKSASKRREEIYNSAKSALHGLGITNTHGIKGKVLKGLTVVEDVTKELHSEPAKRQRIVDETPSTNIPVQVPSIITDAALSDDPSKRVVSVSLSMTVEELQHFVSSVNARNKN